MPISSTLIAMGYDAREIEKLFHELPKEYTQTQEIMAYMIRMLGR